MPKSSMKGHGGKLRKMMKCIFIGKRIRVDDVVDSSESLATRDYSIGGFSSQTGTGDNDVKTPTSNIEEAESSLRESGYLNYEVSLLMLSCDVLGKCSAMNLSTRLLLSKQQTLSKNLK